jgi:hypothetical protein
MMARSRCLSLQVSAQLQSRHTIWHILKSNIRTSLIFWTTETYVMLEEACLEGGDTIRWQSTLQYRTVSHFAFELFNSIFVYIYLI